MIDNVKILKAFMHKASGWLLPV